MKIYEFMKIISRVRINRFIIKENIITCIIGNPVSQRQMITVLSRDTNEAIIY